MEISSFFFFIQPINDSFNTIEYSLGQNISEATTIASPEPLEENEENILQSDELGEFCPQEDVC